MNPSRQDGQSDATVVRRVLDGHRQDYEVLVRRYQERFHRFALGMVGDSDVASDLVQAALVKAYSGLDTCQNPERFESWAYQILRNLCRDHLKDLRRGHEPLDEVHGVVSPAPDPAAELDRSELRQALREALASLPDNHREAFLLKHLEGRSYSEIARILGGSVSAMKMRVHRSREMLQAHLVGAGDTRRTATQDPRR